VKGRDNKKGKEGKIKVVAALLFK
jgi:hypothetical protein